MKKFLRSSRKIPAPESSGLQEKTRARQPLEEVKISTENFHNSVNECKQYLSCAIAVGQQASLESFTAQGSNMFQYCCDTHLAGARANHGLSSLRSDVKKLYLNACHCLAMALTLAFAVAHWASTSSGSQAEHQVCGPILTITWSASDSAASECSEYCPLLPLPFFPQPRLESVMINAHNSTFNSSTASTLLFDNALQSNISYQTQLTQSCCQHNPRL